MEVGMPVRHRQPRSNRWRQRREQNQISGNPERAAPAVAPPPAPPPVVGLSIDASGRSRRSRSATSRGMGPADSRTTIGHHWVSDDRQDALLVTWPMVSPQRLPRSMRRSTKQRPGGRRGSRPPRRRSPEWQAARGRDISRASGAASTRSWSRSPVRDPMATARSSTGHARNAIGDERMHGSQAARGAHLAVSWIAPDGEEEVHTDRRVGIAFVGACLAARREARRSRRSSYGGTHRVEPRGVDARPVRRPPTAQRGAPLPTPHRGPKVARWAPNSSTSAPAGHRPIATLATPPAASRRPAPAGASVGTSSVRPRSVGREERLQLASSIVYIGW